MVRPIFWQNPVRVTRPVPPGRCPVTFHPLCFMTGRSFNRFASVQSSVFRHLPVFRLSPAFQPLPSFQFSPVLRPFPIFRVSPAFRLLQTSSVFPGLTTVSNFFHLPRSYDWFGLFDHLRYLVRIRSFDLFRPPYRSVLSAIPTFRLVGFSVTGDLNYS